MLIKLRMIKFRQFEDRTVDFAPGLVVFRGGNEHGKTTHMEAVGYALFGTKMLRDTLDDCVTWGTKTNKLKVSLSIALDGIEYTVVRKKSGAEVNYVDAEGSDQHVTGQSSVTKFFEQRFGIPVGFNVNELLFSEQSNIQGVIKQGSTALATTIEKLAGFGQIDQIIDKIKELYSTGSDKHLKESLESIALRREGMEEITKPSEAEVSKTKTSLTAREELLRVKQDEMAKLQTQVKTLEEEGRRRHLLATQASDAEHHRQEALDSIEPTMTRLEELRKNLPGPKVIQASESRGCKLDNDIAHRSLYDKVQALISPKQRWQGGQKDFEKFVEETSQGIVDLRISNGRLEADKKILESKLNYAETCNACDQKLPDLAKTQESNKLCEDELRSLALEIEANLGRMKDLVNYSPIIADIGNAVKSYDLFRQGYQQEDGPVGIDHSVYPPRVKWDEGIYVSPKSIIELVQDRNDVTAELSDWELTHSKVKDLELTIDRSGGVVAEREAVVTRTKKALADFETECGEVDNSLAVKVECAEANCVEANESVYAGKVMFEAAQKEYQDKLLACEVYLANVKNLEDDKARVKAELKELDFWNDLITAVRKARVLVASNLWGTILDTVSIYFSSMRGEPSVMTKGEKGFMINNKALSSHSGSTLDICGLAMRLALTQIFVPAADFVILDEVSAGCDDSRTGSITGFLMGLDILQILLITHKDVDEGVANQLVQC